MYPLLLSAVWYGCIVLLKTVSSDEMLDNLRFMFEIVCDFQFFGDLFRFSVDLCHMVLVSFLVHILYVYV